MKMKSFLGACVLGVAIGAGMSAPLCAETLRIVSGSSSAPLNVPMNRAVVVESEQPFSELSIANPGIADVTTLSDKTIYVLGKLPGRTSMTILAADGKLLSNVEVQVTPDIGEFKERLKQILPGENIEVRTLAEPNLTALSGQQAKFLAGGEYPIPVVDSDSGVTIQYKPFGVEMAFTPRVVDGDLINLEIAAAVSGIDTSVTMQSGGFSVNAFKRRETSTTVEMRDGESFAIAGLLQDDFNDLNSQIPWLGDVPVLGALFRSSSFERNQSELVIIVTPHLVSPTHGEALALPTDRVRLPSESELFLMGKTAEKPGAAGEIRSQLSDIEGNFDITAGGGGVLRQDPAAGL